MTIKKIVSVGREAPSLECGFTGASENNAELRKILSSMEKGIPRQGFTASIGNLISNNPKEKFWDLSDNAEYSVLSQRIAKQWLLWIKEENIRRNSMNFKTKLKSSTSGIHYEHILNYQRRFLGYDVRWIVSCENKSTPPGSDMLIYNWTLRLSNKDKEYFLLTTGGYPGNGRDSHLQLYRCRLDSPRIGNRIFLSFLGQVEIGNPRIIMTSDNMLLRRK